MIKFVGVSKKYKNDIIAVSNINFTIDNGEFVFLVGPSGAGKSTILKLLLREEIPTTGSIFVDKKDITKLKRKEVPYLRRNIGVVFQDFKLLPNKTVYENIAFALQIVEAEPKYIRRRVPMVLSLVGLSERANSYPQQLSGGEQQRVSIARAIVNEPSILVADEPTGNLDPDTSWEIVKLLSEINKRGTTVIMSTHAKDIVDSMKKRVIALEKGNIVRDEMRGVYGYEA
ncbi:MULTISPECIES: cell division ATP-binding protein FtsE [Thermoanaerobacterium]|uniref:Cell division ATP-binding protein FtsE n=3 Tax=Thermoanaerobacterium TaxID=28895 RepID=W9E7H8_9THEO|nr:MULTISPECIES: cell division ATP-binding protein FtsE [Thermoanaerobacterium]AEF16567.1 cell division ATP-binding protein FtsE [Thermoanaerobacterium xylanolyticum LX-11]AFK86248.1 cell division ATP-binding protein FtsE [Thermoanaerobacterium saccharolyticum JW/SL-YS485]ETO37408.1 cell division ATP-binding protein FtsE [Thermoanaerobacterium aotearoense SCUT27]MDE4541097.1 cell division ATP-binding protein FtsE [Thermoanaerobacterium sp. R66]ORX23811.1 cell division ATP-binding protein FtsE 